MDDNARKLKDDKGIGIEKEHISCIAALMIVDEFNFTQKIFMINDQV